MDLSDIQSIELKDHSDWVRSVAFSPDGQLIASGSEDKTVRLWGAKSGNQIAVLNGHEQNVYSVAFSPDGTILASGSVDKTIKLWSVVPRIEIASLLVDSQVYSVAFSPDGTLLASGSYDKTVKLWDVQSKARVKTMKGHEGPVWCVAFSPDGKTIASGSQDKTIRLWEVGSGTCLATLQSHKDRAMSVAFSPDGNLLASGSYDKTIILWNVTAKVPVTTLQGHTNVVRSVAFTPNGKYLASASYDKIVRFWDLASRSHYATLNGHSDMVSSLSFSPDGSQLASASMDNIIRLWSLPSQFITYSEPTVSLSTQQPTHDQDDAPPSDFDLQNDITGLISLDGSVFIGFGGFGDVISGNHQDRGRVALKRHQKVFDEASARRFLREVNLWCSVSHRYILPCLGMCKFDPFIYVVSPFIENGDLRACMSKGIAFNCTRILYEVAEALTHLHYRGIVHGDVKAQNVLLSPERSALLCDFGLAKALDSMVTSTENKGAGSSRWMAPELFENASRSMATDVYSFGITIAEVLSGEAPYSDIVDNLAVIVHVLFKGGRPRKVPSQSPEGKSYSLLWEAAEKCWEKEAEDRPYMAQALAMLFPLARERN